MIISALVIKHKMNPSNEETILVIQENPYMQYFVGLSEFTDKPVFDSSLFVTIRKRLGTSGFNDMSVSLLIMQVKKARTGFESPNDDWDTSSNSASSEYECSFTNSKENYHEGSLKIDITCADAKVRYPSNIDLLHRLDSGKWHSPVR